MFVMSARRSNGPATRLLREADIRGVPITEEVGHAAVIVFDRAAPAAT